MYQAVFLNRDGTLNESHTSRVEFVNQPDQLYLLPGVADAIALLRAADYKVFVVTNQGRVSWGMLSEEVLHKIHHRLNICLQEENTDAIIDEIVYCPHHPLKEVCSCRKPKPGMLLHLAQKHQIDLMRSWMVGDRDTDLQAGQAAGCQTQMIDEKHSLFAFAHWIKGRTNSR